MTCAALTASDAMTWPLAGFWRMTWAGNGFSVVENGRLGQLKAPSRWLVRLACPFRPFRSSFVNGRPRVLRTLR